jgi:hypothetical protein
LNINVSLEAVHEFFYEKQESQRHNDGQLSLYMRSPPLHS